jgi:Transposase, Mutator family
MGMRSIRGSALSQLRAPRRYTTALIPLTTPGSGLKRAITEVLPEPYWQRCYVRFLRNTLDYLPRKTADDCLIDCRNLACRAFRNKRQPRPHVGWVDAQPAAIQLDFSPICFGAASAARYPLPCQNRWG